MDDLSLICKNNEFLKVSFFVFFRVCGCFQNLNDPIRDVFHFLSSVILAFDT